MTSGLRAWRKQSARGDRLEFAVAGLGVEGVDVAGAARHKEENAALELDA